MGCADYEQRVIDSEAGVGMSEVFVARQPIFDRWLDVAGYELLFRDRPARAAVITSPPGATGSVVLNSLTEIGLERIIGARTAWIDVSREFVLGGLARSLPPSSVVLLEIIEDESIDDQLIAAIRGLRQDGHRLALHHLRDSPSAGRLLRLADVVKLDLLVLGRENLSREIERLKPHGVTVLAEKLETQPDYRFCVEAGCDLFQGYFFCRPEHVRGGVDVNRLSLLEVLAGLQDPAAQLSDVERMIALDLRLSYRLFRFINSAFFGMRQEVRSIGQALALLGIENLKHWVALSIFTSITHKPSELILTALIRARFCELAGERLQLAGRNELFTLGLFSVIDALMDTPMEAVLTKIPFPQDMREALITHGGEKGSLLEAVTAMEAGEFDRAEAIIPSAGELYPASLRWANEAADPLFNEAEAPDPVPVLGSGSDLRS
jgi:c-di-GMP phosphodiesterase